MRYDKRNQKTIDSLHPKMQEKALLFLKKCVELQLEVLIYCGRRTFEEQAALYAKGRTTAGRKVTGAKPGQSWHNFSLAFDCVPVSKSGKCLWGRKDLYRQLGRIGEEIGLKWGGKFLSRRDQPHFEYHPKLTIPEALKRHEKGLPLFDDEQEPVMVTKPTKVVSKSSYILATILDTIKKALNLP